MKLIYKILKEAREGKITPAEAGRKLDRLKKKGELNEYLMIVEVINRLKGGEKQNDDKRSDQGGSLKS